MYVNTRKESLRKFVNYKKWCVDFCRTYNNNTLDKVKRCTCASEKEIKQENGLKVYQKKKYKNELEAYLMYDFVNWLNELDRRWKTLFYISLTSPHIYIYSLISVSINSNKVYKGKRKYKKWKA